MNVVPLAQITQTMDQRINSLLCTFKYQCEPMNLALVRK